jgi:hypothetical protein
MVDPVEGFAEGLEEEIASLEATPTPAQDPVLDWLKSEFDGFDATDRNGVAEHLEFLQAQAKKAEEYEQKVKELEARQILAIQNQTAPTAAPAPATPTESAAAEIRRLEAIRLDPALQVYLKDEYVTRDANGMLTPKVMVPQVIQACDIQNRAMARQSEIAQTITGDWYGAFEETLPMTKHFKEMQERLAAFEKRFEESLTPIQKNLQQSEVDAFNWANKDILFVPDPAKPGELIPSAAGELYGTLVGGGKYTKEEALEIVKPLAAKLAPPPAPAAPAPAAPKPKPARFIEPIARRMAGTQNGHKPTERKPETPFEDPEAMPFKMTMADVRRKAREMGQG